jgi:hypothetical protein
MRFIGALFAALFSRSIIVLAFWLITITVCVQAMYRSSFTVGAGRVCDLLFRCIRFHGFAARQTREEL